MSVGYGGICRKPVRCVRAFFHEISAHAQHSLTLARAAHEHARDLLETTAKQMNELVKELHEEFCRLTGQTLTLSYQRLWSWGEIAKRGYNTQDLAILIRWIKSQMTRHGSGYSAASLQFNVLISDPDKFEDRLNLARKALSLIHI
jgi:hypothetical protein